MWCKVVILAFFLVLLFLLSRLREAIAYYEGGYLASRLLDPVSLSAKKLKLLLDQRGVSYAGVVEKQELKELVQTTGDASAGELETASKEDESSKYTEFKGGSHFYEEVEDCKDSVWVVQVVHSRQAFMAPPDWASFVHKVSRFGVHTGYFDCALDEKLCARKGWYSPRLVLALPQGHKAKDNVILKNYVGSSRTQPVLDWVNSNLASRIKQIQTLDELAADWLHFDHDRQKLRVILVSTLTVPPMFYSVLSVKFTGRARFGTINSSTAAGQQILNATQWTKVPSYVVLMPEQEYKFGLSPGEYPNFSSMALFLKTLQPEVNDMFLLSLIMVNVMCWFELVLSRGNLFKRLGSLMWHVCKWNCLLILLCFPVLGMFQLPYMTMVLEGSLKLLRLVGTSFLASLMRADWLAYYSNNLPFLLAMLSAYAAVIGFVHYKVRGPEPDTPPPNVGPNLDWNTYANFLFQPISGASPFGPTVREMVELDAGMEMLIEQLSLPNIWLGPLISNEYLKELPVWRYTGPNIDSDIGSDCDCLTPPRLDSEGEQETSPPSSPSATDQGLSPAMFVCEKCRALQEESEATTKESRQSLAQARMDSESACAKYLMDSNYKCMCKHTGSGSRSETSRGSPRRYHKSATKPDQDTQTYQPPPGMLPTLDCSICLEGLKYGVTLCGLPCKHSFHLDCIMHWLKQYNHLCPLCRWPAYKAQPCSLHSD